MNILQHVRSQPFVTSTGVAALIHSTWSLGTFFAGQQPDAGLTIAYIGWLVPAFLIAFALDVGQMVTASEIKSGNRSWQKYVTFTVFAIATYYLQWLYIVHHFPKLAISPGVSLEMADLVVRLRDWAIWGIPALLPLSTLLYTLSHSPEAQSESVAANRSEVQIAPVAAPLLSQTAPLGELAAIIEPKTHADDGQYEALCPHCDWQGDRLYATEREATNAVNSHLGHCQVYLKAKNARRRRKEGQSTKPALTLLPETMQISAD